MSLILLSSTDGIILYIELSELNQLQWRAVIFHFLNKTFLWHMENNMENKNHKKFWQMPYKIKINKYISLHFRERMWCTGQGVVYSHIYVHLAEKELMLRISIL